MAGNPLQSEHAPMPVFFNLYRHRLFFFCGVLVWSMAVAGGFAALSAYTVRAGKSLPPPPQWPEESGIPRIASKPNLLVFAHPRCPCSTSTLEELAKILEQSPVKPAVEVIFFQPKDASQEWGPDAPLWQLAKSIPGVTILADPDGEEARRFGALTSGQTLLFDAEGNLLFRGGITAGRGERGANPGSDRILSLLQNGGQLAAATPIFGCPIFATGGTSR